MGAIAAADRADAPLFVVSVGAGQDSTAAVYRLGLDPAFRQKYAGNARILCVMAAVGDEHADTDAHVPVLEAFCKAHDMEFVHITFDMGFHRGAWAKGLRAFYESKNTIGSAAFPKTCTDNLKISVIYRFLAWYIAKNIFGDESLADRKTSLYLYEAAYGKLQVFIGIAFGEESRVDDGTPRPCDKCNGTGIASEDADERVARLIALNATCRTCKGSGIKPPRHKWMEDCISRIYPLIDERMDRAACQAYIRSVGRVVPPASNCYMCPYKSPIEILWSWMVDPERFAVWVRLEQAKLDANVHMNAVRNDKSGKIENKNYGVFKHKTLPMVLEQAKRDYAGWSFERVAEYRHSHGHCVTSKY